MTPRERYLQDPHFHALVSMFFHEFEKANYGGAGLTPTEIREASGLAWQMYAERLMMPSILVRKEDL